MNLIYQISVGPKGDDLLRCCIESLRTTGNYKGDILVFTDHDIEIEGAIISPIIKPSDWKFETISILRVKLGLGLPFEKYENVMYLDTDHLAFNDINCFFDTQGRLWGMNEGKHTLGQSIYHGGYLTDEEKARKDGTCYCSGILCGPSVLFQQALAKWNEILSQNYRGWGKYQEQSALNVVIYRNLIDISSYSSYWICGARRDSYSAFTHLKMVHFWHRSKNSMARIWKHYSRSKYAQQSNNHRGR